MQLSVDSTANSSSAVTTNRDNPFANSFRQQGPDCRSEAESLAVQTETNHGLQRLLTQS